MGEPGQEFVEPLKQPKESGVKLDVGLSKKDEGKKYSSLRKTKKIINQCPKNTTTELLF